MKEKEKALGTVSDCWELVEEQCNNNLPVSIKSTEDVGEGPWRIARVFVSSTFTDFFCEREVLVKKV
jgi:hypothetical protein